MSGQDVRMDAVETDGSQRAARNRLRPALSWGLGSWGLGIVAVVGITATMNQFWKPQVVDAQAPVVNSPRNAASAPTAPNRAAGATRSSSNVQPAAARGTVTSADTGPETSRPANSGSSGKAATTSAAGAPRGAAVTNPDLKVVALVNGEQVTRQDLSRECIRRYGKDVLESMVNKHLILQACQQQGVKITEQDVEDEIERIAGKFNLSVDRWMQLLQEERSIAPSEYRREIIWPTLALRTLAANQIKVSDEELQQAFDSEYGPQVRVRLISVETRKKADEAYQRVSANPADFPTVAKDLSEDASASIMGLIPAIRRNLGDPEFERVAFSLKPGQVSPIFKLANKHIILKCEEHIKESYLAGDELRRARAKLSDRIQNQKMRSASGEFFKKLQEQAQVVNVLNDEKLQKQHPGVAALINNQQVTMRQLSEECIQRHGITVLDGEINRLILQQELKRHNTNIGDDDIESEVARAAESYGKTIEEWLKQVTETDGGSVDLYVRDAVWPSAALKKLVGTSAKVTEDDIQKGFQANFGERVEVLAIVLSNQRQAQQVWEQARDNPTDNWFGDLAHQYSVEPASRANYGKVPPLRRHGGQPLLEEQAFSLKPGELSSIVAMGDKFIILRCLGRTKPVVPEMTDEVRQELVRDMTEKKLRNAMAAEFDRLKEATPVDNFLAKTSNRGKPAAKKAATANQTGSKTKRVTDAPNQNTAAPAGPIGPAAAPSAKPKTPAIPTASRTPTKTAPTTGTTKK